MQQQKEITFAVFACLALAYSVSGVSEDIDVNLLRTSKRNAIFKSSTFIYLSWQILGDKQVGALCFW